MRIVKDLLADISSPDRGSMKSRLGGRVNAIESLYVQVDPARVVTLATTYSKELCE